MSISYRSINAAINRNARPKLTPEQVARALRLHADELPAADWHIAERMRARADQLDQAASEATP